MEITNIDSLPARDYSENPRHNTRVTGERSAISLIDLNDRETMQRYRAIDWSLPEEFSPRQQSDRDLLEELAGNRAGVKGAEYHLLGVVGSEGVKNGEIGELQGFLNFYEDENVEMLTDKGFIPKDTDPSQVIEVSYAKHPDAAPRQMSSALRQACLKMSEIEAFQTSDDIEKATAQLEEEFVAKKAYLTADEAKDLREEIDAKIAKLLKPKMHVTAYVELNNEASPYVLAAAGFDYKGEVDTGDETPDIRRLYILNWDKLHKIMQDHADEELFSGRSTTPSVGDTQNT